MHSEWEGVLLRGGSVGIAISIVEFVVGVTIVVVMLLLDVLCVVLVCCTTVIGFAQKRIALVTWLQQLISIVQSTRCCSYAYSVGSGVVIVHCVSQH